MKQLLNIRADVYMVLICVIYAVLNGIYKGLGVEVLEQLGYGLFMALISFVLYYVYEALYSLVFYKLRNEIVRYFIGLFLSIAYLYYLVTKLFVNTTFSKIVTDINQLNEGLANITVILSVMTILSMVSLLYGHSLGETLYRLSVMFVIPIGNTMIFFYYNPLGLDKDVVLLSLNVFLIYFTLRQLIRSRGLVVLNEIDGYRYG